MGADDNNGNGERDEAKIRRRRNVVLGLILGGLVILFLLMTMVRIRSLYGP